MKRKVLLYANDTPPTRAFIPELKSKLSACGIEIAETLTDDTDLIFCIGGDGTFLHLIHELRFPSTPILGVHTGHVGFFQDLLPAQVDEFLDMYVSKPLETETVPIIQSEIETSGSLVTMLGINEMLVRGRDGAVIHIGLSVGDHFIERFSGDGILVATPSGSTAYNYSLGGSIVDPRVQLLQVTPIAPINNRSYRSLTSSLILPATEALIVEPEDDSQEYVQIETDGFVRKFDEVTRITISFSKRHFLRFVRFRNVEFWAKIKDKYL